MITDVHSHLGEDYVFDIRQTEEDLISMYDRYHVDKAIIQPFMYRPYIEDMQAIHDRIYRMTQDQPGRFFGMTSINPHFRWKDIEEEAERCFTKLKFVGIKISTIGYAANPSSKDGLHIFDIAKAYGVPVMIHTGNGAPLADPASAWKAIELYPEVKTVLAHTGGNSMQTQAIMLCKKYDNVYLEPSWMPSVCVGAMIKEVGADRVMFSSDEIQNFPTALEIFTRFTETEEERELVLSGTAHKVYGI